MELFWWLFTVVLFAVGLIGTVLPVFPGTTFILAGAILHRLMLGPGKSIGCRSIPCRQENDGCWPGRLGEFDGKSRRDDRQTRDRTRHDHDLLHDRAIALLSSWTKL